MARAADVCQPFRQPCASTVARQPRCRDGDHCAPSCSIALASSRLGSSRSFLPKGPACCGGETREHGKSHHQEVLAEQGLPVEAKDTAVEKRACFVVSLPHLCVLSELEVLTEWAAC